ncbi:hypothetical protein ABEF92_003278 [Exophiala dermatitidis]|uniref:Uncharacterized protein n=2 Tax=Exophiala dermatitidis TaxID=5970 RepID=H6BUQ7_EXODN|nr:uncharacterized protein HMPREF1120_03869 [Exophiala dermatitidis NIH/UT8656]EHY55745.1 hypothetical protein HMPREF1120_03869 [Exophiala dermatitidis NIH/UT8656]
MFQSSVPKFIIFRVRCTFDIQLMSATQALSIMTMNFRSSKLLPRRRYQFDASLNERARGSAVISCTGPPVDYHSIPTTVGMAPPTRSQLLDTSTRFIHAYNAWTTESILSVRSPRCIHRTLPASRGRRPKTNDEFRQFIEPLLPVYRGFRLSFVNDDSDSDSDNSETVVDVEKRKVVLHLKSHADTDAGPYENEYYFVLSMNEAGDLVDEVVEYLDSGYTDAFMRRLEKCQDEA